jgi:hypothetical protein
MGEVLRMHGEDENIVKEKLEYEVLKKINLSWDRIVVIMKHLSRNLLEWHA